jgi:DNA-binding GntR family transcriptional regulator
MAPSFIEPETPPAGLRRSVPDVATALREAITVGTYQPNERLVEEELAKSLGTNRAVVRGALALLHQEGLVVRERNRGARVRAISVDEAVEILEARSALEGVVARRAAERMTDEHARTLRALLAQMREKQASGELQAYTELNARFHRTIRSIAAHATSEKLLALLQSQAVRYQFRTVLRPGRPAESLAEHTGILNALLAHDPDAAERAARHHVAGVINAVRAIAALRLPE